MRNLILGAVAATALAGAAGCTRDGNAQTSARVAPIVRDDTASVARLLNVVRGVDPVLCELATRHVDMHGRWSHWGNTSGDPLEMDSVSAALVSWVQNDHNDPAVVPRLRAALRDADVCVRRVAGSFLGRVEHPSAAAALVSALDDANAGTRAAAAIGLGLSDQPEHAVDPLIKRLRDDSAPVRRSAAWALGAIEAREAMPPLIDLLQRDADPRVRQAAAWALGQISK